jgi:hypothetical protein
MKEQSNLKREFSKKDVQRMRNIITGKAGDRTQVLSGYQKQEIEHKEGDIWEESGKKWTIKNGIKQTVTVMDRFKKLVVLPLCCPSCNKPMKLNDLNKKMYAIHSTCFDCVLEKEQKIKLSGNWEEYTKGVLSNNHNVYLGDVEQALEAWYNENESFITEAGDVETWKGGNKKEIYDQLKKQLTKIKEENG